MDDLHKPLKPMDRTPGEVPSDIPETEERVRTLPEGQIPGLPVSHDPLSQPMPRPQEREIPPLD